jgi:hypothetical protein
MMISHMVCGWLPPYGPLVLGRTDLLDTLPVILCIPARNEEASLPTLLSALSSLVVEGGRLTVCIYLDDCQDRSATLLDRAASDRSFRLCVTAGQRRDGPNAGVARHAAMTMALDILQGREALLFVTDADSIPQPDWIMAGQKALAEADVVAGRITRSGALADPEQGRLERYYDRLHRYRRLLDPVPWEARDTHHFGGGANMAMRASAYRAVGGFKPLATAEDATFLDDAARAGLRVRRDRAMVVETSSRREGRAANGLAGALRALDAGEDRRVAHPAAAAWQWSAHAAARQSFTIIDRADIRAALGDRLGLTPDHVLGVARDCPNGEAFAMRIVPASPIYTDLVGLAEAENLLSAMERQSCEIAA